MARDLLGDWLKTSVVLNGLVIPPRALQSTLARHSFNLFINNEDDEVFRVTLRGSATALRFHGRELLLCTQHQLAGIERQRVGMLEDDGSILVTSGGMRHYTPSPDTDANDIVAFNFTEPCEALPQFRRRFFDLRAIPPHVPIEDVTGVVLAGFPFNDQTYEIHIDNHIDLARRIVLCRMDDRAPADNALLRVTPIDKQDVSYDGMSGGSAFVVQWVAGEFRADFAGLIVRGGSGGFYILKAGAVMNFLKSIDADWDRQGVSA